MDKYSELKRTTLAEIGDIPHVGVYVIAYMGKVVYVGKAESSVYGRLANHMYVVDDVGAWMRKVQSDWDNVRLDVLAPPVGADVDWIGRAEEALIHKFSPLFNTALNV